MKSYDLIKRLLEENIELRSDDQLLQWTIWEIEGSVKNGCMYYSDFRNAKNPETIRRNREMVQADHPELGANEVVKKLRHKKEKEKGTFVYRDIMGKQPVYNSITQTYEYL